MEKGKIEIQSKKYDVTIEDEKINIELKNKECNISDIISELNGKWNEIVIYEGFEYKNYYKVLLSDFIFINDVLTFNIISKVFYPLIRSENLPIIKSFYITAPAIDYFVDYKNELLDNSIKILNKFKNGDSNKKIIVKE